MQDVHFIEDIDSAVALLKPQRIEIMQQLDRPRTCPDLADYFGESAQKIYYHIKALEKAGLVEKVDEKRVRGTVEGHYQAVARSYWLAPQLVGRIGDEKTASDQVSLRMILQLAEEVQTDLGKLGTHSAVGEEIPSLSMSGYIHLPDAARRAEFLAELQATFQSLAAKYGLTESGDSSANFRLILMCYPRKDTENG
ncbi:MAG: helix-turn-helix domain-containing protein [Chloroflexi bacterium]|nr:helix-turn-helix domain-containing protein [Chloroflexota bacterium]